MPHEHDHSTHSHSLVHSCRWSGQTSICIFSRNRPIQLFALLRSLKYINPIRDITVLYSYDEEYLPALEEIKSKTNGIHFHKDDDFKGQVITFLKNAGPACLFLVDDIVFRRPFDTDTCVNILTNNPQILTYSLRMGLHLNYCYPVNRTQPIPDGTVQNNHFLWNWRNSKYDWNYPFSVDGNVFRTDQMLGWIQHLEFTAPNSFEEVMQTLQFTFAIPDMCICYTESSLFNNPLNRVQDTHKNRSGKISSEYLLEKWNEGLEIDISKLSRPIPNAAHFVVDLPFKERK